MRKHVTNGALSALCMFGLMGCGGERIDSEWRTVDIEIDGEAGDWSHVEFVEKDDMRFAVVNDGTHLYACIIPGSVSATNQIMLQGLTVWFDAAGGEEKAFGVRFPLGLTESSDTMKSIQRLRQSEQPDRSAVFEEFKKSLTNFELRTLGKSAARLAVDNGQGIEVQVGLSFNNSMIYELKVPLAVDGVAHHALGVSPGVPIGVGLDSPEFDREVMMQRMGSSSRGSGGGKGGGGRGGGRRGGRGGSSAARPEIPDPIDIWGKLQLAAQPLTDVSFRLNK